MLIDPFVVVAQIVNFIILVVLLKRFLYKPITQAMEGRARRIERQLAAAALKEENAAAEKKLYLQKQQELEAQKQAWLERAQQEVEAEREQLTQQARAEVAQARSQWYENLERDRQRFIRQLRDRLSQQVAIATGKALLDLANANLERQIIATFITHLSELDSTKLKAIRSTSISNQERVITIRSSFNIADEQKEQLRVAISERLGIDAQAQFEITTDLLCGIELRFEGYKISWNLQHYLQELETETAKILVENNIQAA